jgi:hypothetical protein
MLKSTDEVLDDLRKFVAGRGRDDNFCYSKSDPTAYNSCTDFSPWVGRRLLMNDTFALAVLKTQLTKDMHGMSITLTLKEEDQNNIDYKVNYTEESGDIFSNSFEDKVKNNEEEIIKVVQFPFDGYFTGETKLAKLDLMISWILDYHYENFSKILMAYNLSLNNAQLYLEKYIELKGLKKSQLELLPSLPNSSKLDEFRKEFRKLPLATRLHLFDVLTYSGFNKNSKKPKLRFISDMVLYATRNVGIDEHESANILSQNKLIFSLPDGTGYINPEYVEVTSIVADYANRIVPAYREWYGEVSDKLSGFYDDEDEDFFDDE